jgi:hypothetical protein
MKSFLEKVFAVMVVVTVIYASGPMRFERHLDDWGLHAATRFLPHSILNSYHLRWLGWDKFEPQAGYSWVDPKSPSLAVVWKEGRLSPEFQHVVTSPVEGEWLPEDGFVWRDQTNQMGRSLSHVDPASPAAPAMVVVWTKGLAHRQFPHIMSVEKEGYWAPNPGYHFKNPKAGDMDVVWSRGESFPGRPHLVSAFSEGGWVAEAGYRTEKDRHGIESERWTPGTNHPDDSNIIASDVEGVWVAKAGYKLTKLPDGRLVAVLDTPSPPVVSDTHPYEITNKEIFFGIVAGIICLTFETCRNAAGTIIKHEAETQALRALTK